MNAPPDLPHLGAALKRKCLMLAVECAGDLERLQPFRDQLQRTPVEDLVARFLERAMLAYANMTDAFQSQQPHTYVEPLLEAASRSSARPHPDTSAARKVLGEVATLLRRVEVMQRDGVDATPEKLELLGKALLMLEERITLDEDETSKRLAVLEKAFGVAR